MSAGMFGDVKEQVRQATDLVDLVGKSLELRRQGRNYVGLCPWHDDRKPSLQVNPDRQSWKCWVCDIGGDVFSWVMQREGCDFREALEMLAEQAGVTLAAQPAKKAAPGSPDDKNTLYQCCEWAARQFHEYLLRAEGAEAARQYVEERAITPASAERFKIGFAPKEWSWLVDRARSTSYSPKVLEAVGLVRPREGGGYYDWFRGRLIFPIRDTQGRTIAFGGRILPALADENAAKYINSPETRLYSKSDTLYALDLVRGVAGKSRAITVVEGYTDVILCHQHGVDDAVACCGTALGPRHLQLLKRFADTVYLVLDGDEAGQRRTTEILELFVAAQMDVRIVTPPDELDPAEFVIERGGDAFLALRAEAVDALEHKIRTATRGIDLARDTHRANLALEDILSTIARGLPSGTIDSASLRSQQLLARLARQFALDELIVRERFSQLRRGLKAAAGDAPAAPATDYKLSALSPAELELLQILAAHPELAPTALFDLADDDLPAPAARELFGTYRRLEEAGASLDFSVVLAEIESPQLKSLLVAIDEREAERQERASRRKEAETPAAERLRATLQFFHRKHIDRERRELEAALESKLVPAEEEQNVFDQIVNAKRRQQGIAAPTEG